MCQVRWIVIVFRINDATLTWFLPGVSGNSKTMHTGFSAYVLHYANAPGADTEETGRYDLAWKDLCSVLNALSK